MLGKNCRTLPCRQLSLALALTLILIMGIQRTDAQQTSGSVTGTVVDEQRRGIPGVGVMLTNQNNGIPMTAVTDEHGFYRLPAVEPGPYTITFSKTGFQTSPQNGVAVNSSVERTVDRMLHVAGPESNVTVIEPAGEEIAKTNATIQTSLSQAEILDIPINVDRNTSRESYIAPLVIRGPGQNEAPTNGARGRNANFTTDGVNNNDGFVTISSVQIPPEGIQEYQVMVFHPDVEFGKGTGSRINVITKGGSNNYRGELWNFYRGNALEPLSLANRRAGVKKCSDVSAGTECGTPMFNNNQLGISFGGPIVKEKTFFFGIFQANLKRSAPAAVSSSAATIPTPAGYATLQTLPLRKDSSGNVVQSQASRDAMLNAISFIPSAWAAIPRFDTIKNITVNGTPVEVGTFVPLVSQPQNGYYNSIRLDHRISSTDRMSYRYVLDFRKRLLIGDNLSFGPQWGDDEVTHAQNHALSYTKTIGSNFVNEARFAYMRRLYNTVERDPVSPTVTLTSLFTIGGFAGFPQNRTEQTYQFQNTSNYILGHHSVKFGWDLQQDYLLNDFQVNSKGTWTFSTLDNFMNNVGNLTQALTQAQSFNLRQLSQAYFAQDDWKLSKSLTVNLGIRYDTTSVPYGFFGATDPAILAVGVPGPVKRDTNNWGPRVGFAYSPDRQSGLLGTLLGPGKSSLRGGFAIGYDVIFYNIIANTATSYPRTGANVVLNNASDVFPVLQPKTGTIQPLDPKTSVFVNMPSDSQNPTTNYWTLIFQREIGRNSNYVVEVGYSGNRSYHAIRQGQANPGILSEAKAAAVIAACSLPTASLSTCINPNGFPSAPDRLNPAWGSRQLIETTGKGRYDAGYIQFDRKFNGNFTIGLNYTYSANFSDAEEALNDITSSNSIAASSPQTPQDFLNYRNEWSRSVFDRPQRLAVHYMYAIPWFANSPRVLKNIFGGWRVSGFSDFQSGQPFSIRMGIDTMGSGTASGARPDLNPGGILLMDPVTGNLRTFTIPKDGTGIVTAPHVTSSSGVTSFYQNSMPHGGTLPRNSFRGPGFQNWNVGLARKITVAGDRTVEFRGDFFNVFNHDNFLTPDAIMNSATFGLATGPNTSGLLTDARQIMLGVKIRF